MVALAVFLITIGVWTATQSIIPSEQMQKYPISIIDDLNRVVNISETPERIVSLSPNNTEILFALGLENKIVGVTNYCDYPQEAKNKENIGGFSTPSVEKIVALMPDLVLADDIHKDIINEQMQSLGLTIVVISPESINGILDSIRLVGQITESTGAAEKLILDMEHRINKITDKTKNLSDSQKTKVFFVIWIDPLMTFGPNTYGNEIIQLVGGVNIAVDATTEYPIYNMEVLVERNPDVIIVSTLHGLGVTADGVKIMLAGKNIAAVANNRIHSIDASLIDRAGPRVVEGLEAAIRYVHPELLF